MFRFKIVKFKTKTAARLTTRAPRHQRGGGQETGPALPWLTTFRVLRVFRGSNLRFISGSESNPVNPGQTQSIPLPRAFQQEWRMAFYGHQAFPRYFKPFQAIFRKKRLFIFAERRVRSTRVCHVALPQRGSVSVQNSGLNTIAYFNLFAPMLTYLNHFDPLAFFRERPRRSGGPTAFCRQSGHSPDATASALFSSFPSVQYPCLSVSIRG
jgi:hypothetical protein